MKESNMVKNPLIALSAIKGAHFSPVVFLTQTAPEEVAAPTAVATATTLLVSWDPPSKPNGNITGYFLYQDLGEVYAGGERQFLVTQLRVSVWRNHWVRGKFSVAASLYSWNTKHLGCQKICETGKESLLGDNDLFGNLTAMRFACYRPPYIQDTNSPYKLIV